MPSSTSAEVRHCYFDGMNTDTREETGGRVLGATRSPFLVLPPELRLTIYEFALLDSTCVTVGHAEVVGRHSDVVSREYAERYTRMDKRQTTDFTLGGDSMREAAMEDALRRRKEWDADIAAASRFTTCTPKTEHHTKASLKATPQSSHLPTTPPSSP